jgi:two-component system, sensor histidine kinase ChiS
MKKILIIEDEPAYVRLLRDNLKHYELLEAKDGQEGLDLAKKVRPDLILLDIRMPVLDGLSVLKELRKDPYGKTAKVILLTNQEANSTVITRVAKDLPTYYLMKSDIRLEDLLDKIRLLLEERVLR